MKCIAAVIRRFGTKPACLVMTLAALIAARNADAATTQSFVWVGSSAETSLWSNSNCWMYHNGNRWRTTTGTPDGFSYDVYFRSPMTIGSASQSYDDNWNHVVTFGQEQTIGNGSGQPVHIDEGSREDKPIEFTATQSDYGLTSSSYLLVGEKENGYLRINSGTYKFSYFALGYAQNKTGHLTLAGGKLQTTGNYPRIGANGGDGVFTITSGGVYDNLLCKNKNFTLGQSTDSSGTLNINGGSAIIAGELIFCYGDGSKNACVNVTSGGVLTVGKLKRKTSSENGSATLTLDGGTLKAYSDSDTFIAPYEDNSIANRITVYAGLRGATIDSNGYSVTIAEDISDAPNDQGGFVNFAGGGTITFTGSPNYSGKTTITAGTKLVVSGAVKTELFKRRLEIYFTEAGAQDGAVVLELSDGELAEEEFEKIETKGFAARYTLVRSSDGQKVLISDTLAGEYVWNGGNSGSSWSSSEGNWSKDGTPGKWYDSTHAVFKNDGDKATVDGSVTAASVKFNANTTVLAGEGGTLTTPEINVLEGVTAEIEPPTSGPLEKYGKGTLKLDSSRTEDTTLSEGELVISGTGTTLDITKLTLKNNVTLRLTDGAAFSQVSGVYTFGVKDNGSAKIYNSADWSATGRFTLGYGLHSTDEYFHEGGDLTFGERLQLGNNSNSVGRASFTVSGGSVKLTSAYHIYLGYLGTSDFKADMLVENDARVEVGCSIIVGNLTAASLTIKDNAYVVTGTKDDKGYIAMAYHSDRTGGDCVLNLFGGTLETKSIERNKVINDASQAIVNIDGGTLKAKSTTTNLIKANDNLTVTVGAKGGTIDTAGYVFSIGEPLTGDGGVTFKGGGTATLASDNTYKGPTTIEIGTAICLPSLDDINDSIVVSKPESLLAGVYTIVSLTGEGKTFSESDLGKFEVPLNSTLKLSLDKKSILCIYDNPANTWIGGASGNLLDAQNWHQGVVPSDGCDVVITSATEATLELPEGKTFNVGSITFPKGSAKVTIDGKGRITGVTKIVNESGEHHKFLCEVDASASVNAPELPLDESNYLVFTGGLKLSAMPSAKNMRIAGHWLLKGDWDTPPAGTVIVSGSTVDVSGTLSSAYELIIDNNSTLKVANVTVIYGRDDRAHFIKQNNGTLEVTECLSDIMESTGNKYDLEGFFYTASKTAVTKAYALVNGASTADVHMFRLSNQSESDNTMNTIVLGSGGLSFKDNHRKTDTCYPYFQVDFGKSVRLASSADWTIAANSFKENGVTLEVLGTAIIDTSDYDDETAGHTITAAGRIGGTGQVNIAGCGKLLFEAASTLTCGLTVTNTATAAFKEGANPPASCSIAVESGAALEVAESATVAISGNLSLKNGAIVAFNYTARETPVLDLTDATLAYEEGESTNVTVRISAADRVRARTTANNENVLTTGGKFAGVSVSLDERSPDWARGVYVNGDGDIVLKIQPLGTTFILK